MRDFGGWERTPREVVRVGSAAEVAAVLRRAPDAVARGCGHSTDGRSLTGGVTLDLRGLAGVPEVGDGFAVAGAGATWRDVLDATLPHGATPPVLTDLLDLTVGGTLSAGGLGGTSHVHGTQADNVLELEVVTRDGRIAVCSPERERALFDAVRGGAGRHGVITRATLRNVPAPRNVLSCRVPCASAADLLRLQAGTRAWHLSGQARPDGEPPRGWRYELKAVFADASGPPDGLAGAEAERLPYRDFADRLRPDVAELVALGEWDRPHPWAMALLPGPGAAAFIERTLAGLAPADIGLSGVVLIKAETVRDVPMLRAPDDPVLFGLLRTASPGCRPAGEMAAANDRFLAAARAIGGTPYPTG